MSTTVRRRAGERFCAQQEMRNASLALLLQRVQCLKLRGLAQSRPGIPSVFQPLANASTEPSISRHWRYLQSLTSVLEFATRTMWPRLSYASGGHGTKTTMKNYSRLPVRRREVQVDISQTDNVDGLLVLRHRRVQQIVPEHQ